MRGILRTRALGAVIVVVLMVVALLAPVSASAIPAPTVTVYRFYNQGTGSHFYTASIDERDYVIATWPDLFTYEGPAFYLYDDSIFDRGIDSSAALPVATPVHRFFNMKNGSHFYTISAAEADAVKAKYPGVFRYDGVSFSAYEEQVEFLPLQPVHRFYNVQNGSHFYTISAAEKALVQLYYGDTYRYEGVAFYAMGQVAFN